MGIRDSEGRVDSPLTKELRMDMARLEIPVSGWTCFRTAKMGQRTEKVE